MKILTDRELELIQQLIEDETERLEGLDQEPLTGETLRRLEALNTKLFGPAFPTDWAAPHFVERS